MRNQYYQQKFEDSDGKIVVKYIWSQDISNQIYPQGLTPVFEEVQQAPMVGKMTVSQIQADRQKRSKEHFQKEIRPTLGKDEQIHFNNKYKQK